MNFADCYIQTNRILNLNCKNIQFKFEFTNRLKITNVLLSMFAIVCYYSSNAFINVYCYCENKLFNI